MAAFGEEARRFLLVMIAREEMRCIIYQEKRYVILDEIEPYSPVDLDETFTGVMLPANDPSVGAASALAESSKRDAVQAIRTHLIKLNDVFPSAEVSFAPANPFKISSKRHVPNFWRDVAFVGANLAGLEEAKRVNEAFAILATSVAAGLADEGLAHFHKVLLSTAAPELAPKFDWIWSPGRARLYIPANKMTKALEILSRLTLTFSGYRGDPEGSETPRSLMDLYLAN
ncbi:hypothetical protein FXV83_05325 [Bradyrhizobium hipponense]|uniref:Uncharacterized protein n=1 Tax=Bradyrhizobium hipponense TaxID=2605638 RepID=A0A5S4YTP7_9BRAD|nr:hypothetical protein [Bradyrhizobium hipponense]TYO67403.1 hypothetical protein FXV83_05325 [Bradyrhizobium hipponense]